MPQSRIYNPYVGGTSGGSVTPAELAAAEEIQTQAFNFSSGTFTMFTIPALSKIFSVSIEMITAFDDPSATLIIGDAGLSDRLMPANRNSLDEIAVYQYFPIYEYMSATNIIIQVNAGASTQGSGYITIIHNSNN